MATVTITHRKVSAKPAGDNPALIHGPDWNDTHVVTGLDDALDLKLSKASNLSDLASSSTARTNLGLENVDNTSDANKPVSTAQAAADALKANLAGGNTITGQQILTGNIAIGANIAPDAQLTINGNTAASVTPPTGSIFHIVSPDGLSSIFTFDGYGGSGIFTGRRANGTLAAKSKVLSNNNLMQFVVNGWQDTTSAYGGNAAVMQFIAAEDFTSTAQGTKILFGTTPLGTASRPAAFQIQPSGGVSVGSTAIASDPGVGCINATNKIRPGSFTVATLPTGVTADAVYCTNCRVFNGAGTQEGATAGTGGMVHYNGSAWKIAGTNITAVA